MTRIRSFVPGPARSGALLATFVLALAALACDSGTQEPDAPTPAASETGAQESAAAPSGDGAGTPPAAMKREGEIDSARFPTELPEGVAAAVPGNFPSDVPLYPGSQPAQGKGVDLDGSAQSAVQLLTNDAFPDVHKFYSDQLQSKGWTIGEESENEAAATITATKDKCKAHILVTPADGGGSDIFLVTEC